MMDDRDDGFFSSFFGGDFDKHFRDAMKDMDEMFRKLGDFHIELRPPPMSIGGKVPGYNESPRDMMLKPDSNANHPQQTENIVRQPRQFHPGFRSPFNSNNDDINNRVSIFTSPGDNVNIQITSKSTSFRQNPDGSMEKIVKTLENGRSCTTVTKTDKDGNTTTTTTCDRPGDVPNIRDKPPSQLRPLPPTTVPIDRNDGFTDDDKNLFQKYFKDWFKPKDS